MQAEAESTSGKSPEGGTEKRAQRVPFYNAESRAPALEEAAERRRVFEAEARQLLAAIVDSSDDAIISKSLNGIITSWNRGAVRIFGYTAEETIGRPIQMLFPPERLGEEDVILERLRRGERVEHFETVRVRKDGVPVDLSLTISPVRDSKGKLIGASKIARDITERRRSHEELQAREQFLRAIVETTPECIKIVDAEGMLQQMNPAGLAMIGAKEMGEMTGKSFYDVVAPEDRAAFVAFNHRVCEGEAGSLCFDIVGIGGVRRSMESFAVPLSNPEGKPVHLALTHDITEELRSRQTLQRQNVRLKLLNEAAGHLLAAEEPDEMARGIFQRVRRELGVQALSFYVMDEATGELMLLATEGLSGMGEPMQETFGRELAEKVAGGRAIAAEHIEDSDDPALATMKRLGFKAAVCEPLKAGHRPLGTLCFASSSRAEFDEGDRQFIRTVCHYVSIAYERVRLVKKLRSEDRRKDEFLATLAHELRNPLAPLCSTLELFRMGTIAGPVQEQLREMMQQQLRQLTRLVDDLMEVSRITSGKISLKREQVDIAEVIQNAVDMSRPQIDQLRHELLVSLPTEALIVDADPMRLAQVFVNLLNNAAKYTEERGKIEVVVRREGGQAVISVRDTGLGIPHDMLPQVFDMFAQVDRTLNRSQGGLGIGLALARQLVALHGGRIEAHSAGPGKGSEFIVRLACIDVLGNSAKGTRRVAGRMAVRQRRVLVADDNREAAISLSLLLQTFGHTTRVAFDGQEALEMAAEFRPDAVVMDIGMPRLNGYATARQMREFVWGRQVLLIALSGWGQDEDRRRARDAGFDLHFTKPIDIDALISLLENPRHEVAKSVPEIGGGASAHPPEPEASPAEAGRGTAGPPA